MGEPEVGWANLHCSFAQAVDSKNYVLLDSDSTDSVFCNSKFVTNIHKTDDQIKLNTNKGPIVSNMKCDLQFVGEVWFNPQSITNIISLKDMTKLHRVTMDSNEKRQ